MADRIGRVLDSAHIVVGENFGGFARRLFLGASFPRGIAERIGLRADRWRGDGLLPGKGDAGGEQDNERRKQKSAQPHEPPTLSVCFSEQQVVTGSHSKVERLYCVRTQSPGGNAMPQKLGEG